MNADATKRLKAAKGSHAAAVRTAVRGLARANAHADWLRSREMAEFTTDDDREDADAAVRNLMKTMAMLVLDAPEGTFTASQVAAARRTVAP